MTDNAGATHSDEVVVTVRAADEVETQVMFTCHNAYPAGGQHVVAVGNIADLGSWKPENGLVLSNIGLGQWQGSLMGIEPATEIQWKCVIVGNGNTIWQNGGNNRVNVDVITTTDGRF